MGRKETTSGRPVTVARGSSNTIRLVTTHTVAALYIHAI